MTITDFLKKIKEKKLPFFLTFCYCISKAANEIPEFRQRISGDQIREYEKTAELPHTVALEDGTYCYCTLDSNMPFSEYLPYAVSEQNQAKEVRSVEDNEEDGNELIFISTLPWFSYTSFIQPVPMPADSNPRITWGRYSVLHEETVIPVSVLCHTPG